MLEEFGTASYPIHEPSLEIGVGVIVTNDEGPKIGVGSVKNNWDFDF